MYFFLSLLQVFKTLKISLITKFMKKTIENKIRLNVILIYLVTILLCTGIGLFFYYNRNVIEEQKEDLEKRDKEMTLIKELINSVNTAQKEVNLYISTKRNSHLRAFRRNTVEINHKIDTLKTYNTTDSISINLLQQLSILLKQKERTIFELRDQFNNMDISSEIKEKLETYKNDSIIHYPDSFEIKKYIVQDTIVKAEPPKKFWKKLSGIFSSEKQQRDTVITSFTEITDTIKISLRDSINLQPNIDELAEWVEKNYESRISSIEEQVIRLIMVDQDISSKISTLLTDLHNNMIDSRLNEIRKSEYKMHTNNKYLIMGGGAALLLILIFIIFIINNANKGLRMRQSLEKAQIRTKHIMESRHKLLLSVSHDIKTPLNSIIGYLEINNDLNKLTPNDQTSIRNSGKYILSLLNNLLDFSSLEQGKLNINITTFNVYDLCKDIKEMFTPLVVQKGLSSDYSFNFDHNLRVTSDLLKLKQIAANVLSNAIKYTPSGKITFQVDFDQEKLHFTIADTGVGIPHEQIENIFEPFTRIDGNKNMAEGTGFGLYVVKGLVDLLGGKITIESTVGQGTIFSIKIPAPAAPTQKTSESSKNILIIDDDPAFLNLLTSMLKRLGHTVVSCNTSTDFDEQKKRLTSFDMIFTDMDMGNFSGMDVLLDIRKQYPDLPVFVITGHNDFNQTEAHKFGFNGYIQKPVTMDTLAELTGKSFHNTDKLSSLREMFDDDEEAVREIIKLFIETTDENLILLHQLIHENKFREAQAVCHKMLPMFLQTGMEKESTFLKKMDRLKNETGKHYLEWKADGILFINNARKVINDLNENS